MGIHDRDYARDDDPSGTGPFAEPGNATRWLLGITIGVFVLQLFSTQPRSGESGFTEFFQLDPARVWHGEVWRLLTYGFFHNPTDLGGVLQLVFSMMILWFFGRALEERHGSREFVVFYLGSIFLGGLAYAATVTLLPPGAVYVGSSAAAAAIVVLYAVYWPNQMILFFVVPAKIWVAAIIYVALTSLLSTAPESGFAGHINLTAALFGLAYGHYRWNLTGWVDAVREWQRQRSRPRLRVYREEDAEPLTRLAASLSEDEQLEAKMDAILEKISRVGQENLTPEEKEVLRRASEVYRKRRE